jgi:hypothetical protein
MLWSSSRNTKEQNVLSPKKTTQNVLTVEKRYVTWIGEKRSTNNNN